MVSLAAPARRRPSEGKPPRRTGCGPSLAAPAGLHSAELRQDWAELVRVLRGNRRATAALQRLISSLAQQPVMGVEKAVGREVTFDPGFDPSKGTGKFLAQLERLRMLISLRQREREQFGTVCGNGGRNSDAAAKVLSLHGRTMGVRLCDNATSHATAVGDGVGLRHGRAGKAAVGVVGAAENGVCVKPWPDLVEEVREDLMLRAWMRCDNEGRDEEQEVGAVGQHAQGLGAGSDVDAAVEGNRSRPEEAGEEAAEVSVEGGHAGVKRIMAVKTEQDRAISLIANHSEG
jgi:hypothetical protein